jgi:hypothetical protein
MWSDKRLLPPLALAACLLAVLAWKIIFRLRVSPGDRERRRRLQLGETGRLHSGLVTDLQDDLILYSYELHGVSYTCSQDISSLRDRVPADSARIVGPVTLKYFVRNPANSIVISERWSGLRIRDAVPGIPLPKGDGMNEPRSAAVGSRGETSGVDRPQAGS